MPITIAPSGRELRVSRVNVEEKTKRHLRELGISEGGKVTVISSSGGNVILIVKEGRLCLDRTLAGKIFVA